MLEDLCEPALSIKLSPSEDGERSDLLRPDKDASTLKCFRCYGRRDVECGECGGTERVSNFHPLALLLGQVLERRVQGRPEGQRVSAIEEEEEETEQRRGGGVVYAVEGQGESGCLEEAEGLAQCPLLREEAKACHNCGAAIENCYSACRSCLEQGKSYWVCDSCSDSRTYIHPPDHTLEPLIDYDELRDKMETISQDYEEDSIEKDLPDQPITLDKKNSSIANYLEEDTHFLAPNSSEVNRQPSRVKFELDGLFSSYDFKSMQKVARPSSDRKSTSKGKAKTRAMKENLGETGDGEVVANYAFADYKCDFCEMQPILNVRFHCRSCQDYDLCEKCYEDCDSIHEPHPFDRIDARFIREQAVQRLFQLRDTNLRTTQQPFSDSTKAEKSLKATLAPRFTGQSLFCQQ